MNLVNKRAIDAVAIEEANIKKLEASKTTALDFYLLPNS